MVDSAKLLEIIKAIAAKIEEEKYYLTELDDKVADGDHGINMANGFKKVLEKLPDLENKSCGPILVGVGMTLIPTVGGAGGMMYGTAFMKAGSAIESKNTISMEDLLQMLERAISAVMFRGGAKTGQKTMLDAMCPAYEAMMTEYAASADAKAALAAGVQAAEKGVEYTKTIEAETGKAFTHNSRPTIGHPDPGAASFTMMLQVIHDMIA